MIGAAKAMMGGGGALRPQDVFATTVYTRVSSQRNRNTGIDLLTNGGLLWQKTRSGADDPVHYLSDTARGITYSLNSNSTAAQQNYGVVTSVNSTGFVDGFGGSSPAVAWSFRRAAKFFDVVTWTGNGVDGRDIAHVLGVAPGLIITKRLDTTSQWQVAMPALNKYMALNSTQGDRGTDTFQYGYPYVVTSTTINLIGYSSNVSGVNASGGTYVAYLFAHDPDPSGIVQCGSFTADGAGVGSFDTGWSGGAQFAMIKCATASSDWEMLDTTRTPSFSGNDARLRPNLTNAEDSVARVSRSAGTLSFAGLIALQTYVALFIREPIL